MVVSSLGSIWLVNYSIETANIAFFPQEDQNSPRISSLARNRQMIVLIMLKDSANLLTRNFNGENNCGADASDDSDIPVVHQSVALLARWDFLSCRGDVLPLQEIYTYYI
jgi:hypothetical protein